jgi:hypothetical protein
VDLYKVLHNSIVAENFNSSRFICLIRLIAS